MGSASLSAIESNQKLCKTPEWRRRYMVDLWTNLYPAIKNKKKTYFQKVDSVIKEILTSYGIQFNVENIKNSIIILTYTLYIG